MPAEKGVEKWPVTRFRTYLDSPYAFYVQHVLRRREVEVTEGELDAGAFGDLLHNALARFGLDEERRTLTDVDEVAAALGTHLDDEVRASIGTSYPVGVEVQIEQAMLRLHAFAPVQAAWAAEGWRISRVEWQPESEVLLDVPDDEPALLLGRIDRVDINERDGRVAIIDYKSGKRAKTPRQSHQTRDGEWRDLQLPLYRRLARELGAGEAPLLAYALLPPGARDCAFEPAPWSADELDEAEGVARWVVQQVRAGVFDLGDRPSRDGVLGALGGFGLIDASGEGAA
jgi:ATP-dependent exoDNAse (exonuclease V) beta subunit